MSRSVLGYLATILLAACSTQTVSPDAAELGNIWRGYLVPQSNPATVVGTFDQYCVQGSGDLAQADRQLRDDGFVALPQTGPGVQAYVVDDERPAVGVTSSMCLALAASRTGQTARFQNYVSRTYPNARRLDPAPLGRDIEDAWFIPQEPPAIIVTERTESFGFYRYALILFQPGRS